VINAEGTSARLTGSMALRVIGLNKEILLITEELPFDKYVVSFVMELVLCQSEKVPK
jgi:hypothetical protein